MRRTFLAVVLLAATWVAWSPAAEARRVALVIGIGAYDNLASLPNPVPDARAIGQVLGRYGFEVYEYTDLGRADLLDALEDFEAVANGAEVALAYYAGHGMEVGGDNIIAPSDAEISCDPKEARRAVELDKLFDALGRAPRQVVLIDACRNDPFPQCPTRSARQGSGFRGFSQVAGENQSLLIANATLPGELAADGAPGDHSPFAKALLARFETAPDTYFRDLLDLTARDVQRATGGAQIPEVTTRGGAPRICLSADNCGDGSAIAALPDAPRGAEAEVRTLLTQLGYPADSRGGDTTDLADAIRAFQGDVGLPADGQVSPTLLAVLRATTQVAALTPDAPPEAPPAVASEYAAGTTFRDCANCPEMVAVAAGTFTMGAGPNDPAAGAGEGPPRDVTIDRPFAVSRFEITFDEWEACALEGGCNGHLPRDGGWSRGSRPVIYVSWDDAKAYVDWLRRTTGEPYRLLTEAEWEYAARAGTTTPFSTGATITTAQAVFDDSATAGDRSAYLGRTAEVGSYPPNPFGLHDMHGNVWEWVEDCWNDSHAGAPTDGSARGGDCTRRVVKGGAWYFEADTLRAAARQSYPTDKRLNVIGFRIARGLE
ncbi:SUMF1/EgtB/PvdO family nonheme iron enzyme [Bauldia sp.]|uniref:SUMF1/EgtB/PvdO family nonheme iron enzyme n=1 Tax=Bauldia sp. TaxID=2575872 RepID=UPI003BAA1C76